MEYTILADGRYLNSEAVVVIDRNRYRGIGRPRKVDYKYSVSHLLPEKKIRRARTEAHRHTGGTKESKKDYPMLFLGMCLLFAIVFGMILL
jgi:hypothetical protein